MTFAIFLICAAACSNTTGGGTTESPAAGGETKLNCPDGPITMLVGYSAGGGSDMACRTFADPFSQELGTAVTISNMEGGSGTVAVNELRNSDPDVPTLTELGYENCSMASYCGLAVPRAWIPRSCPSCVRSLTSWRRTRTSRPSCTRWPRCCPLP